MPAANWKLDCERSKIAFSVRHLIVSRIRGRFLRWSGALTYDETNLSASRVTVEIAADSIQTDATLGDDRLKSEFLEVKRYPSIGFVSQSVDAIDKSRFRIRGSLTVRGASRPVTLEVRELSRNQERATFSAKTTLHRKDFDVSGGALDQGGLALSDKVEVEIEITALRD